MESLLLENMSAQSKAHWDALLDIFDPAGYNLFVSNKVNENLRNAMEVMFEKYGTGELDPKIS